MQNNNVEPVIPVPAYALTVSSAVSENSRRFIAEGSKRKGGRRAFPLIPAFTKKLEYGLDAAPGLSLKGDGGVVKLEEEIGGSSEG